MARYGRDNNWRHRARQRDSSTRKRLSKRVFFPRLSPGNRLFRTSQSSWLDRYFRNRRADLLWSVRVSSRVTDRNNFSVVETCLTGFRRPCIDIVRRSFSNSGRSSRHIGSGQSVFGGGGGDVYCVQKVINVSKVEKQKECVRCWIVSGILFAPHCYSFFILVIAVGIVAVVVVR